MFYWARYSCAFHSVDVGTTLTPEPIPKNWRHRVSIQLNWYPEAEHGGVFQAVADGTYTAAGLNVDIRPGGRATPVAPELSLGRVQFAIANADDVIVYRGQGMDIVAVAAPLQNNPRCILVRQESGVESLNDLKPV